MSAPLTPNPLCFEGVCVCGGALLCLERSLLDDPHLPFPEAGKNFSLFLVAESGGGFGVSSHS